MEALRGELRAFYRTASCHNGHTPFYVDRIDAIRGAMDRFAQDNPDCPAVLLKARLHEEIAAQCEPVIFPHSPFYYEIGLKAAENWGIPERGPIAGRWLLDTRKDASRGPSRARRCLQGLSQFGNDGEAIGLWSSYAAFDADHHCLGTTRLLRIGINGILAGIDERLFEVPSADQRDFLTAARMSCLALLQIADKFGEKAREMLPAAPDPQAAAFLTMIAETAPRVPAEPPATFYEGLAALWFLREVAATMESIGISVIGHPDRQLIGLYRDDLAAGRITEDEARDLLARWMLPTDIKFHIEDNAWPETSSCIMLGGCDEDGREVFNDLTRMIIDVHGELALANPKLNCRYTADAPEEYLAQIAEQTLSGHNVFALLNDDVLIPACVRAGKTEREARLYANGGCQETVVEGVEHSAGAYYYFNLARVLDLCLQPAPPLPADAACEELAGHVPKVITGAENFQEFYDRFCRTLIAAIAAGAAWRAELGKTWSRVHPCPLFSATLDGCIEKGMDYTAGGARYNPSGIALVGLGTVVDSLFAIRRAVFEDDRLTLDELREALAANWVGHESLRARLIGLPKYGHDESEVDALAADLARGLAAAVREMPNERGDRFQSSLFVYYAFAMMGQVVRATPDGRRDGDFLTQGIAPGRLQPAKSLTDTIRTLAKIDFTDFPGNAVLDVQVPAGDATPPAALVAAMRTFAGLGGPTLQFNCVSVEEMKDAQRHPDRHRDLMVRISGLSAHFVALHKGVQDEIIGRTLVEGT